MNFWSVFPSTDINWFLILGYGAGGSRLLRQSHLVHVFVKGSEEARGRWILLLCWLIFVIFRNCSHVFRIFWCLKSSLHFLIDFFRFVGDLGRIWEGFWEGFGKIFRCFFDFFLKLQIL